MKVLLPFFFLASAEAARLEINEFDQEKLALLMNRLPSTVLDRKVSTRDGVRSIRNIFPKTEGAFRIECESSFHDGSPVPSNPACAVTFDIHHPELLKNYDEWRIEEKDSAVAPVLFEAISPRGESRFFRSGYHDEGTDFSGRRTTIFHYLIQCTKTACLYRFSEKRIR